MKTSERRWNELQTRWASGDSLNADEERERIAFAASDPLARRELELFAELRSRAKSGVDGAAELADRVWESANPRPRLRVIGPDEPASRAAVSAPARGGRALHWAGIAGVAAAGLAALYAWPDARPSAPAPAPQAVAASELARSELVLSSGEVSVNGAPARVGEEPLAGRSRVTTRRGRACLTIDPGIDVCLGPESSVVVESLAARRPSLRVEHGVAVAALTRRDADRSFSLTAGDVSATALGTVFSVERAASGAEVAVVVVEGRVEVARDGQREVVAPHSRLILRSGVSSAERSRVGRGEEARLWSLAAPRELWTGVDVGVLDVTGPGSSLAVAIDEQAPLELPLRAFVPAGRRKLTLRAASGAEAETTLDVVAGETRRFDAKEPLLAKAAAPSAARTAPEPTHAEQAPSADVPGPAVLLEDARRELGRGNARQALALYQRLRASFPASPEARTVLVTIGKLELDLQQPARALSSFDAYLRAPGALAPEALAGRVRALRALGRGAEERRAIERYLERHPNGFEAAAFARRLETLERP